MITSNTHSKEWFQQKEKEFPKRDPGILERVIKAFTLLEQLVLARFPNFIFKGGTSLILILKETKRFSVDIDLCVENKPDNLHQVFDKIVKMGVFEKWEMQERKSKPPLQKEHYKFYYTSVKTGNKSGILLDLIFQDPHYKEIFERPIEIEYVETTGKPTNVKVLSVDCMLGDKLTAFAPNTCGIPYGIDKELEIIKQLYDVSRLFAACGNISLIRATYEVSSKNELGYSGHSEKSHLDALEDSFNTAHLIATRGRGNKKDFEELSRGIKGLASFMSDGKFFIDDAVVCSSHVAYLTQLLKIPDPMVIKRYDPNIDLTAIEIRGDYKHLNKLKKNNPEAFFYFNEAVKLREGLVNIA